MAEYDPRLYEPDASTPEDRESPGADLAGSQPKSYTPLQLIFLLRLTRFDELRRTELPKYMPEGTLVPEDWRGKLIIRALFSCLQDCNKLNLGNEATQYIQRTTSPKP